MNLVVRWAGKLGAFLLFGIRSGAAKKKKKKQKKEKGTEKEKRKKVAYSPSFLFS